MSLVFDGLKILLFVIFYQIVYPWINAFMTLANVKRKVKVVKIHLLGHLPLLWILFSTLTLG